MDFAQIQRIISNYLYDVSLSYAERNPVISSDVEQKIFIDVAEYCSGYDISVTISDMYPIMELAYNNVRSHLKLGPLLFPPSKIWRKFH